MATTPPNPDPDRPFELGLVMAGAVSAGAYTAGVIDFLIQALDEWQKAKDENAPDCPPHEVRLKVMAGASAGGITAAIAAGQINERFEHVTTAPSPGAENNKLFESWVDRIDIGPLLGDRDLRDSSQPVQSILDSTILRDIAANAFQFQGTPRPAARRYLADPLHIILTVTNLRGVPYTIQLDGDQSAQYGMTQHGDAMHFTLGATANGLDHALPLIPRQYDQPPWQMLRDAALASGAFPGGLSPQALFRTFNEYNGRKWPAPGPFQENSNCHCNELRVVDPSWPDPIRRNLLQRYDFLCVDGGTIDNEPLELARRALTGDESANPRSPDKAIRALLLVDPFPNMTSFAGNDDLATNHNIFSVLMRTFTSLINQARFKPEELVLAASPNVFSRFLIAPTRQKPNSTEREPFAIASGSIKGFGGFLSRDFREHDFHLGRRNCQKFLKEHFVLPSEDPGRNPLFDRWTEAAKARHRVNDEAGHAYLPIIPVLGSASTEAIVPPWPRLRKASLDALRPRVQDRLQSVAQRLIDDNIEGWVPRRLLSNAWWLKRDKAVDWVMRQITEDLTQRGLLA